MWFLAVPILSLGGMFFAEGYAAEKSTVPIKYLSVALMAASGAFIVWKLAKK